jgi:hypothetical protein
MRCVPYRILRFPLNKPFPGDELLAVTIPAFLPHVKTLMESYLKYPPRKMQSEGYTGPITISNFEKFQFIREQLKKEGFNLTMPGQ